MILNVSLREATPADAERIADVFLSSRKAFLPFAVSPHSDDEVRAWVRDVLLPTEEVTVAVVDQEVVGFLAVKRSEGATWITQLYLDPSSVALGIGSTLLAHAIATAPLPIRLHTFQENTRARRFFERSGFVPIQLTDGAANEEQCPDVLYELAHPQGPTVADRL